MEATSAPENAIRFESIARAFHWLHERSELAVPMDEIDADLSTWDRTGTG